jgi:hypothetical protein
MFHSLGLLGGLTNRVRAVAATGHVWTVGKEVKRDAARELAHAMLGERDVPESAKCEVVFVVGSADGKSSLRVPTGRRTAPAEHTCSVGCLLSRKRMDEKRLRNMARRRPRSLPSG